MTFALPNLTGLLTQPRSELVAQERLYSERADRVQKLTNEINELVEEANLLEKVEGTLNLVSTRVLGQSTSTIDQLVTKGLRAVFYDQKLEFRTEITKMRGKTSILFELMEDGESAPLMDSYGGGVLCMIGVLLRVVTIIVLGQRRILLLDESLAHLSSQYVPQASSLLNKICDDLDFTILMVTHEPSFADYAAKHYEAQGTKDGTIFIEQTLSLSSSP